MADQQKRELPKVTKHDFYFEMPLYEVLYESQLGKSIFSGEVDAFSARNGIDTTYKISARRASSNSWEPFYHYQLVTLECKRKNNDALCFVVFEAEINGEVVYIKVGQWLSLVEIQFAEIGKKYDKFLSREDMKEFKRAIGLAAHGVGAGSFVYLRRIFENLIVGTYAANKGKLAITESEFQTQRMTEKITTLKDFLPSQLVEMKSIYGILSKGVHELTEEECLSYFGAMKLSIELILEQKIELEQKSERDKAAKAQIAVIHKTLTGEL